MITVTNQYLKMDTLTTSMVIDRGGETPVLLYYGKKIADHTNYSYFAPGWRAKYYAGISDHNQATTIMSANGECTQKQCFVAVTKNGIFTNRFACVACEKVDGFESPLSTARNKGETVCLTYVDKISGVTLKQYFTTFADSDVIATHSEVINTAECTVNVKRLMSLQLDFIADRADIATFDGYWAFERTRHDTTLTAGMFENMSINGVSSSEHNPFVMVKVNGGILGLNLVYSGNHKEMVEVSPYGKVRVQTGMNDYALDYALEVGENLVSPEAIVVYATCEDCITNEMHKFSLNHIVNPNFAYKDRPVLINNWEGTTFTFTGEKIYQIAEQAAKCGIEMMVLDDGWFGVREDDTSGLGDWYDNVEKTGGLPKLAARIKALGMKFGLWVEPEMISQNSDLFRAHPEYAQAIPGVEPMKRRRQLCIDMCNDEVIDYLSEILINLFKEIGVDYVKWDHNRGMCDVYSTKLENQGKYFYNYYKNQVKLLRRITEACPNILFESCSSGGSRYDLGMQYFMPQNWASDNSNAFDRLTIQEGTLVAYPQSSMGAHVSAVHAIPGISLESRFNVAAVGAFGYELDITTMSEEELAVVSQQVAYYKEHRHLLQYGNYKRVGGSMVDSEVGGWMVVSDDKSEAMLTVINKSARNGVEPRSIQLKGLDPSTLYRVTSRPQVNYDYEINFTAYGDALMNGFFDFEVVSKAEKDASQYSSRFASRMFYISKEA